MCSSYTAPPSFTYTKKSASSKVKGVSFSSVRTMASTLSTTFTHSSTFPQEFGFYRTRTSDLLVALSSNDPFPLYYISTYDGSRSSQPNTTLYNGPKRKIYPTLATAQFNGWSGSPQITLGLTEYGAAPTENLQSEGSFNRMHFFSLYLPLCGARERFEWRSSGGKEVQGFGTCVWDEVVESED